MPQVKPAEEEEDIKSCLKLAPVHKEVTEVEAPVSAAELMRDVTRGADGAARKAMLSVKNDQDGTLCQELASMGMCGALCRRIMAGKNSTDSSDALRLLAWLISDESVFESTA